MRGQNQALKQKISNLGCFGIKLHPDYHDLLRNFRAKFEELQNYAREVLEVNVSCTWKIHVLVCHVSQRLDEHPVGLGVFAEQTSESVHADFLKTQKRFLVDETHPDHAKKLRRAVVEYSSKRL